MDVIIPVLASITPTLTALALTSRKDLKLWLAALLGGGGWIVALLLRQPLLLMLMQAGPLYVYVASFLAGVFEESFRLLLLRIGFIKDSRVRGALSLGLGWGLTEALILYVIPVSLTSSLTGYSWLYLMPGAVERNSATLIHVSLSLLISRDVRDLRLLAAAITLHTLVNVAAVTSLKALKDVWAVEALIASMSLAVFLPIAFSIMKSKGFKESK